MDLASRVAAGVAFAAVPSAPTPRDVDMRSRPLQLLPPPLPPSALLPPLPSLLEIRGMQSADEQATQPGAALLLMPHLGVPSWLLNVMAADELQLLSLIGLVILGALLGQCILQWHGRHSSDEVHSKWPFKRLYEESAPEVAPRATHIMCGVGIDVERGDRATGDPDPETALASSGKRPPPQAKQPLAMPCAAASPANVEAPAVPVLEMAMITSSEDGDDEVSSRGDHADEWSQHELPGEWEGHSVGFRPARVGIEKAIRTIDRTAFPGGHAEEVWNPIKPKVFFKKHEFAPLRLYAVHEATAAPVFATASGDGGCSQHFACHSARTDLNGGVGLALAMQSTTTAPSSPPGALPQLADSNARSASSPLSSGEARAATRTPADIANATLDSLSGLSPEGALQALESLGDDALNALRDEALRAGIVPAPTLETSKRKVVQKRAMVKVAAANRIASCNCGSTSKSTKPKPTKPKQPVSDGPQLPPKSGGAPSYAATSKPSPKRRATSARGKVAV